METVYVQPWGTLLNQCQDRILVWLVITLAKHAVQDLWLINVWHVIRITECLTQQHPNATVQYKHMTIWQILHVHHVIHHVWLVHHQHQLTAKIVIHHWIDNWVIQIMTESVNAFANLAIMKSQHLMNVKVVLKVVLNAHIQVAPKSV